MKREDCPHLPAVPNAPPRHERCETCGAEWSLRVCGTCGRVGCCESSGAHAQRHAEESGHPIIRSLPLTPHSFTWCYACHDYLR
ncbi:MAG: UBP-type zinc finger domain-containing protein [Gemmatimonadetes bacterium]|nr:UBP-type zinc finger domain-containing protein [Gemmatimonadota bacterium]